MNTRNLPLSAWLVAIGAGMVLIIGAFAHFDPSSPSRSVTQPLPNPPLLTRDDPPEEAALEPALPSNVSPGLAEIIKLAQAHVDEGVMLAYVKNSGLTFSPTADEILYLSDLGLSQDVIAALVKTTPPAAAPSSPPALAAAPTTPLPPVTAPAVPPVEQPSAVSQTDAGSSDVFYNNLALYGVWAQQPDYGLCWQPTVQTIDPNWTPYVDAGQWIYSDSGWYWHSDYTWGWAAFHYGRWAKLPRLGWVWVPGDQWAPAWVAWRSAPSYIGWAPLPPGVSLNVMAQLTYNGRPAGPNAALGLSASAYTFVNTGNLISRNLRHKIMPASQSKYLVQASAFIDSYAIVNNRILSVGVNHNAVAAAAQKPVPEVALRGVTAPEAAGLARDRKTLAVYVPSASSSGASPSPQLVAEEPRTRMAEERRPSQEPVALAENHSAESPAAPIAPDSGDIAVQLPPLRYPPPQSAPVVRPHPQEIAEASTPNSISAHRDWPRGYATAAVEHPSTPAPRFEGFNPPPRPAESPRIEVERRPAPVESRPAPAEPPHAAPAPVAASSYGNSKSGK